MQRTHQLILIVSTLVLSWLGMIAVHELGHVSGAWLTGGSVEQVVLHPLRFSQTDLSHNPAPMVVVWMGPIVGVALPIVLCLVARATHLPGHYILRFFAGFCLIANGSYLGLGTFDRIGDVGEMLALGTPRWAMWLFATICMPLGLWMWHRLGPHFGLGPQGKPVDRRIACTMLAMTVLAVVLTLTL